MCHGFGQEKLCYGVLFGFGLEPILTAILTAIPRTECPRNSCHEIGLNPVLLILPQLPKKMTINSKMVAKVAQK